MIPLGPGGDRKLKPTITYALIAINVIVFLATLPRREADDARLEEAAFDLAVIETSIRARTGPPTLALESLMGLREETTEDKDFWRRFEAGRIVPTDSKEWQRWDQARRDLEAARSAHLSWQWGFRRQAASPLTLITSVFMHGDHWHLLFNMLFLWVVGVNMEEIWGRRTFVILYVLGIVASTSAVFLESPAAADIPGIGASGAIAAVMGAFTIACYRQTMRIWLMPSPIVLSVPAWAFMGLWFAQQLYAVGHHGASAGGVGVGVHALGFATGAAMALALKVFGAEESISGPQEAQRRQVDKARHVAEADRLAASGDARGSADALAKALEADPDDFGLRDRRMMLLSSMGEHEAARAEGLALLERLWSAGNRAGFAEAFARVDPVAKGAVPLGIVLRAAMALEQDSPVPAAGLYVRVIQQGGSDPVLPQALRRYAALLERVGETAKAQQVRAMLAQVEAKRRG